MDSAAASTETIEKAREFFCNRIKREIPAAPKRESNVHWGEKFDLGPLNLEKYLARYSIGYSVKTDPGKSRTIYILSDGCLFDTSHRGKDASIIQSVEGKLFYKCFHDSCKHTWPEARQKISGNANLAEFCKNSDVCDTLF
mgnify:CR=1 FL=1